MQIIKTLLSKVNLFKKYLIPGILALAVLAFPLPSTKATPPRTPEPIQNYEVKANTSYAPPAEYSTPLTVAFLGQDTPKDTIESIIQKKEDFITTRPEYEASLAVIQRHEETIRETAAKYGVPADVAIGVGLLENGGSETAKSRSGALGIFQLMPSTARNLGLTVNRKVDERKDPAKNIDAGMRYLRSNYNIFGDWGLATWAYHAGEGNVAKAVKLYFKETQHVTLAGLKNADQMKQYIDNNDTTVHDILGSASVQKFTRKLHDDSAAYPYKVLATAKLFNEAKESV